MSKDTPIYTPNASEQKEMAAYERFYYGVQDILREYTIQQAVDFLNGAVKADPKAMLALLSHRVPCNEDMQKHPTIQVLVEEGEATLGVLGLINGLVGIRPDGWGYITLVCDDETDEPLRFERTRR